MEWRLPKCLDNSIFELKQSNTSKTDFEYESIKTTKQGAWPTQSAIQQARRSII
jgi:hypothetical protein